jgi:sulfoxide reductase heme-binding subunit YedZ
MEGFTRQSLLQIPTKLYLTLGFGAMLILLVMAITSNAFSMRRLGGKNWKFLHRSVYLASALVTVHVLLIEKIDLRLFKALFAALWIAQAMRFARYLAKRISSPGS